MPLYLKLLLSAIVACGGGVMFHWERALGAAHVGWAALLLAALMIFGVWLFPDTRRRD